MARRPIRRRGRKQRIEREAAPGKKVEPEKGTDPKKPIDPTKGAAPTKKIEPKKGAAPRPARRRKDVGGETTPDTKLVNALETDPEFFKDPLVGKTLGKCKIDKLLGEGRTAVVFRAHFKPLKRTVAVKVLQEHMKQYPAVVRVFQQEGRAVAALDHENVLKIYDVGEDRGQHYIVLELLRGKDLLKHIEDTEETGLPVDEVLDYARQAAAGLAAAHRKKIIHRDIKPQNLVVEPDGTLKVVDFGLAAEAEGAFAGGRLGTPHYMAPEVCRGESAQTASDIYALGVTLYHMLVGRPPYHGRHTTEEIIEGHLSGEKFEPEKHRAGIPRGVAQLIRQMTRMDPKARPTAKEIRETLSKLTPEKMAARQRARGRRAGRRAAGRQEAPTRQIMMIAGGVVIVVIILAFLMQGGDEKDDFGPREQPVVRVPEPEPTPEPKPDTGSDVPVENTLLAACNKLLAEARAEEKTGNYLVALSLYHRVVKKAPRGSAPYKEAMAAYKALLPLVKKETGTEDPEAEDVEIVKHVTVEESEAAGEEFAGLMPKFLTQMKQMDVSAAKLEMKPFLERTREASAERVAVEKALERLGYVEELLKVAEARASSLTRGKAQWATYDMRASPDLIVMEVGEKGIKLKNEESGVEEVRPWSAVSLGPLVQFLDALRNEGSAVENLWLGHFCQLLGDGRSALYYDFALQLDSSKEMRETIRALRSE